MMRSPFVRASLILLAGLSLVAGAYAQTKAPIGNSVPDKTAAAPVTVDVKRQAEYRDLLSNLDQLLTNGSHDSPVYKTYQTVREQMLACKLMFIVDAKSKNTNILQSAYFSPNVKGISWIVCDSLLLDRVKKDPDLTLSLLMNAVVFAEGFYTRPETFNKIFNDSVESFLFSMDAMYIQAMFIRDYLKPHYPKLSEYPQFLADALEFENMATASLFVLGVDQQIVYGIKHFEQGIRDKSLNSLDYIAKLNEILTEVDKKLDKAIELTKPAANSNKDDADIRDRQRYIAVISSLTMLKYGVSLINQQLPLFDKANLDKAKPVLDSFNKRLDGLSAKVPPLMNGVMGYRQSLLSKLGV